GDDAGSQAAVQFIANGWAELEPGLAGRRGIDEVRCANTARGAVECAATARMRIATDQNRAGQGIAAFGDDDMRDSLVVADVEEPLDAKARDEIAADGVHARHRAVGCRNAMIEHHHDLARIVEFEDFAPYAGVEARIDQYD